MQVVQSAISAIVALWNKGCAGKIIVAFGALIILSICGAPFRSTQSPAAATPKLTTVEVNAPTNVSRSAPTSAPVVTEAPAPTNVPEPATPVPMPVPTTVIVATEPSGALGMSRAAWEAKVGSPVKQGTMGDIYKDGTEAIFMSNVLWMVQYQFAKGNFSTPDKAWDIGKTYLPQDATLIKTYQRDTTIVHLYHSEWLKDRFPPTTKIKDTEISNWPEAEPGDFTLQYNVLQDGVSMFIIGLGNNP